MNVPVKRGMLLHHQGHYFFVDDIQERHSGKQKPTVHVALRDALDARHVERTLDELLPVDAVDATMRPMQYLFHRGDHFIFMDAQTFEEIELGGSQLHGCEPFLKEGDEFRVLFAGPQPLRLEMPEIVTLRVSNTAAPSHAVGAAGSVMKEATLENALEVRVPLFIKVGDKIRVDTRTRDYAGKEQA
ncbi:Elongation factor P [Phycisphaerae bacterium RAS1]|nr:Elongation factor P [Phycisphaerae bacterium RAS1]